MHERQFLMSYFDRQANNQSNCTIGPCLGVNRVWYTVKCLGLTAGNSFSTHPLPLLAHPLPSSPQFFAHPRRANLPACVFTRLFNLRLEKQIKRLLRWLEKPQSIIHLASLGLLHKVGWALGNETADLHYPLPWSMC